MSLIGALSNMLGQGGQPDAAENQVLGVHGPVAAQDLNIQTLRGWIAALNNMFGGPAAGEDVGGGVRAIARGLDIHALRGLIIAAGNC